MRKSTKKLVQGDNDMFAYWVFWTSFGMILYGYVGYPFLLSVLAVFFDRTIQDSKIQPRVTLLITAYNEEKYLRAKLENSISQNYPPNLLEIVVASDGSTDSTDNIVVEFAKNHPEFTIRLHRVEGRVGKTATQNSAVMQCRGEIIVFSDAAAMYESGAIGVLVSNFADPKVGGVSGMYTYCDRYDSSGGGTTSIFWSLENYIKSCQTKINTITGCCGCIYAIRRDLYVPLPGEIISDLVEPLMILQKGYRIVFESKARAVEMTAGKSRDEFAMRIRVIVRGMTGMLFVRQLCNPVKWPYLAWQLISHKVVRWLVPVFIILIFSSNLALFSVSGLYCWLFFIQIVILLSAIAGIYLEKIGIKNQFIFVPLYFFVVNIASLISIIKVCKGENIINWQTQREVIL